MSYPDPEEELLDQHLREAFSEFELSPTRQVWKGIEGRIEALPGGAQPLLPLKLLLPALALAGVAAGWLLPRPHPMPADKPAVAAPTLVSPPASAAREVVPVALLPLVAPQATATTTTTQGSRPLSTAARQQAHPTSRPAAVEPLAALPPVLAAAFGTNPAAWPMPNTDSAAPAYEHTLPQHGAAASDAPPATVLVSAASEAPKAESLPAYRPEFRQPTHRRAEKGRGIRRRLAAVGQWARHLVSPRRVRAAGQPNF